jgi:cytochrome c5
MPNDALPLLLASAALLTSCTASQSPPKASLSEQIGEVPADLQSDYQSFAINCSKCHDLDRALAAPVLDHHHWDVYVAKMMRTAGSAINSKEAPHILRFLYWYTDRKTGKVEAVGKAKTEAPAAPSRASAPGPTEQESKAPPPAAITAPAAASETQGETP